ncbi:alpha/beta fold hydrolase [Flavobacterium sharifuzzamanii]|uniref:alpha/beta fold hydrolase n=1 Tax=Flavobacterium sharifuzzamanii TaxID=2211133 RepID=UPI000DAC3B41|nr:alpha/beta hydrolase [Flavobacterium sharifuzzamanii]KAF2082633.1 alpha/beta hydrolase [Flavobacterium sharifuzzamanii]
MKKPIKLLMLVLTYSVCVIANAQVQMNFKFDTPYGKNSAVGKFVELNGAKIYYEEYGKGEPLLLIHGNSGSIETMGNQIDYFKNKYRVIAADSRGHGKSELKTDSLTFVQMTKDTEALVNHLKLDSISIIGWSDGGIVGLQMGISGKSKIKKIVAMGANLRPDSTAIYSWAVKGLQNERKLFSTKIKEKDTSENWNLLKQISGLLADQPNIVAKDLSKIKAKVLVVAGDRDVIRNEHTVEIFENIPKAQLCIMPGETHFAPASSPEVFNAIANKFLSEPFKRPDSDFTKWGK